MYSKLFFALYYFFLVVVHGDNLIDRSCILRSFFKSYLSCKLGKTQGKAAALPYLVLSYFVNWAKCYFRGHYLNYYLGLKPDICLKATVNPWIFFYNYLV